MDNNKSIKINTNTPCEIIFDSLNNIGKIFVDNSHFEVIIIYDKNLKNNYLPKIITSLKRSNIKYFLISFTALEKNKVISKAVKICQKIIKFNINKNTAILTLGGGITGDVGSFCASIILRGLPLFQVPTTLLSQVDSSIGGKTGVNTLGGKNTIGTFYQPKVIFIDTSTLLTLSHRDYLSGYSECLKYSLIYDQDFFNFLDQNIHLFQNRNQEFLQKIITKACQYKSQVVALDEKEEKELRYLLNFGHTFAHALEKYNNYKPNLTHGEAVAMGMVLAFKFSYFLNICPLKDIEKVTNHLDKVGINYNPSKIIKKINLNKLILAMEKDKKNKNNILSFVLVKSLGQAFFTKTIDKSQLKSFLNQEQENNFL